MRLFAYNKPAGEEAAASVFTKPVDPENPDAGSEEIKVFPACKAAPPDQGLVIYTDDESAAEKIKAIADEAEMECHVDTDGPLNVSVIQTIRTGIEGVVPACRISWTEANAVVINLAPCKRKTLDAIFDKFDRKVTLVKRYRIGNLKIKKTPLGQFEEYSAEEVAEFVK